MDEYIKWSKMIDNNIPYDRDSLNMDGGFLQVIAAYVAHMD